MKETLGKWIVVGAVISILGVTALFTGWQYHQNRLWMEKGYCQGMLVAQGAMPQRSDWVKCAQTEVPR